MDSAKQSLALDQRLSQRLSAQQLRFVKLLELTAPELDEAIEKELEDNPALEAIDPPAQPVASPDTPAWRYNARNLGPDDYADTEFAPADSGETLYESLTRQLGERSLTPEVREAANFIIGSLDPNGYLHRNVKSLTDDMAFGPGIEVTEETMARALKAVQALDPAGVGAADLQESLLLQLQRLPQSQVRDDALDIISRQFEAFSMKHTHRIVSALRLDDSRLRAAMDLILSLNPKPGAAVDSAPQGANVIIPDIIVDNTDGNFTVSLNNNIPELAVSQSFAESVRQMEESAAKRKARKGQEFVYTRYNDARDFIRILQQRQKTLVEVMTAIMTLQKSYFETEDVYQLKPMMIKDIAAITGMDFSVISRATTNKYAALPWGIVPLRFFFSDSIGDDKDDTDALTNRKIEAEIVDIVEHEDKKHPLSDENIRQLMEARGYEVSRRTVAKYRDRKEIPVARLRKQL